MSKYWPPAAPGSTSYDEKLPKVDVPLPSFAVQDDLIELYFTHVNPIFPVIDKEAFMVQYNMQ